MSVPLEYLRVQVLHALRRSRALPLEELVTLLSGHFASLRDKESHWTAPVIRNAVLDMVESGFLISEGTMLMIDYQHIDLPENAFYKLGGHHNFHAHEDMNGDLLVTSAHTDDFYFNFEGLNDNEIIEVELIPEPENTHDAQAIAIVYMTRILGYMERHVAKQYFAHLMHLRASGVSAVANARVVYCHRLAGHKYLDMHLRPAHPAGH